MAVGQVKYLSETKLEELKISVADNLERYRSGEFVGLSADNGWSISSDLAHVDFDILSSLDCTDRVSADIHNSIIVYAALGGMTPALAMEERVWARLTHLECLDYARARWPIKGDEQSQVKNIISHFFAPGRTGVRDDNAVSRLWWNMHIAHIADPSDPEGALSLILKTADIRKQIVERPNTAARKPLIKALMRAMRVNQWITSTEAAFRRFMVELNRDAGGVLFEVHSEAVIDSVMLRCAERAQRHLNNL